MADGMHVESADAFINEQLKELEDLRDRVPIRENKRDKKSKKNKKKMEKVHKDWVAAMRAWDGLELYLRIS